MIEVSRYDEIHSIWTEIEKYLKNLKIEVLYDEHLTAASHVYFTVNCVQLWRKLAGAEEFNLKSFLRCSSRIADHIYANGDFDFRENVSHSPDSPVLINGILTALNDPKRVVYKTEERSV